MIESRNSLILLGADVAIPRLGNTCLNDDVTPENTPFHYQHGLTRVYPGLSSSHYQGPHDCAHSELDDDVVDELFDIFERCMDGDCYIRYNPDGDIAPFGNRDGLINVGDALIALRFALELEVPTQEDVAHGDVAPLNNNSQPDPDGSINVGDALVILRKALGLISWI